MGLLGSIGDAIGGAVDFVGDAVGGGSGIGSALGGLAGSIVPGIGTAAGASVGGALGGLLGGGGGGGQAAPVGTEMGLLPPGFGGGGGGNGNGGFVQPSPVDFGPVQFNPGALLPDGNGNGGGGQMMQGGFNNALMMELVQGSVRSSAGRAVIEAMASGSLQGGIIQQTTTVSTPRGNENHSPPGFRTVYVNGQPFAVFKPVAKTLGLLPKTSKAKITAADMKAITKADRLSKRIKSLAQKTGRLKCTNK
jgi:hypothetical protein